jgi:hypothetical protein
MWKQIKAEKINLMNIIEMLRDHEKKLRNVVARECYHENQFRENSDHSQGQGCDA